jgi:hypothetical protein
MFDLPHPNYRYLRMPPSVIFTLIELAAGENPIQTSGYARDELKKLGFYAEPGEVTEAGRSFLHQNRTHILERIAMAI